MAGCEFSRDGGAWQTATTFSGLTANTSYSFTARKAETSTHLASSASPVFTVVTDDNPILSGTVSITGSAIFGETLTANTTALTSTPSVTLGTLTYQWKRGSTNIGTNSSTYTLVLADIGSTITVTVTAANCTGSVTSPATATVTKATQTAPAAPTLLSKTTTSITLNAMAGCEFSRDGGAWQTATTFSGLTANTSYSFTARKAETATHLASSASPVFTVVTDDNTPSAVTQTFELKTGYNWISYNVLNNDPTIFNQMKSELGVVGIEISSTSNGYTKMLAPGYWSGNLTVTSEKLMYKVQVSGNYTMTLSGTQADPATTPIALSTGWNDIGYIPTFASTPSYALAGADPQVGDQINADGGFTTHLGGGYWSGNISSMKPGVGYKYLSKSATTKSFYYPSVAAKSAIVEYQSSYELKRTHQAGRYPEVMTVTAIVVKDNKQILGDWFEIQAFCGNECRGSIVMYYEEMLDKYLGFLMIHGTGDEMITLKVYDHLTGATYAAENAPIRFVRDEIVGTFANPYQVNLGAALGIEDEMNTISIYPNPAKDHLYINHTGTNLDAVEIADMYGRIIFRQTNFNDSYITITDMAKGVYILKITNHNQIRNVKFVKE